MKRFSLLVLTLFSSLFMWAQDESEERSNYLLKRLGMTNRFQLCWLSNVDVDAYYTVILEFDVPSVKENEKVEFQMVLPSENAMSGYLNFFSFDSLAMGKKVDVGFGVVYFANSRGSWELNTQCFDRTKIEGGFALHAFVGPAVQVIYPREEKKYFVLSWNARADEKHFYAAYENRDYTQLDGYRPVVNHNKRERGDLINYNSSAGNFEFQKRKAVKEMESSHSNLLLEADRVQKQLSGDGWSGFVSTPGKAENEHSFNLIAPPADGVIQRICILIPSFAYDQDRLLYSIYPVNADVFQPTIYQSELIERKNGINVYGLTIGYNAEVQYVEPNPQLIQPSNYIILQSAKYFNAIDRLDNITGGWENTDTYKFIYQSGSAKRNLSLTRCVLHEEGKGVALSLEDREFHSRFNSTSYGYRFVEDYTKSELEKEAVYVAADWDKYMLITVVTECDSIPIRLILPNGSYFSPKWSSIDEDDPTVHGALIDVDFNEFRFFLTNELICDEMYIDVYTCGSDEERALVRAQSGETFESVMKELFWLSSGNVNCLRDVLISVKSDHKLFACRKPCGDALVYYEQRTNEELIFSFFPKDELEARAELSRVIQSVLALTPPDGKFVETTGLEGSDWSFKYEGTNDRFSDWNIDVSLKASVQLDSSKLESGYFVQVIIRDQR